MVLNNYLWKLATIAVLAIIRSLKLCPRSMCGAKYACIPSMCGAKSAFPPSMCEANLHKEFIRPEWQVLRRRKNILKETNRKTKETNKLLTLQMRHVACSEEYRGGARGHGRAHEEVWVSRHNQVETRDRMMLDTCTTKHPVVINESSGIPNGENLVQNKRHLLRKLHFT